MNAVYAIQRQIDGLWVCLTLHKKRIDADKKFKAMKKGASKRDLWFAKYLFRIKKLKIS